MTDATEAPVRSSTSGRKALFWLLLPLALFLLAIGWIASIDPLRNFNNGAPPVEALTYERTVLDDTGIHVLVRAGGSEAMSIAQVQVDDAYWVFTQTPPGPIARGGTAWIDLAYPWVLGEAHVVNIVTSTGTAFAHEIPVAVPTPNPTPSMLWLLIATEK
jgi:zinc transporter, ZIP family